MAHYSTKLFIMKKLLGSLLVIIFTISLISCGGESVTGTSAEEAKKECCKPNKSCDHQKASSCAADCVKPCCADSKEKSSCAADCVKPCCSNANKNKTCTANTAICSSFKTKCNTECGTDSTICDDHKADCKSVCAQQMDSTSVNACLKNCTQSCCDTKDKTACADNCKKECCSSKED